MAPYPRHSANRFAQSTHLSNNDQNAEYNQQSQIESANKSSHSALENDAQAPLRVHVERAVRDYFDTLGDEMPTDLYELILKEVELPLLTVVLEQTRGNQTKCAQLLGLNRGTLRKKLKLYGLMA